MSSTNTHLKPNLKSMKARAPSLDPKLTNGRVNNLPSGSSNKAKFARAEAQAKAKSKEFDSPEVYFRTAIETILQMCSIYGFVPNKPYNYEPTLTHWLNLLKEMDEIEYKPNNHVSLLKYKVNAWFTSTHDEELPKKPFTQEDRPDILLGGKFWRWTRKLCLSTQGLRKFDSISLSALSIASACPEPEGSVRGAEWRDKEVLDTTIALTTKVEPKLPQILDPKGDWDEDFLPENYFNLNEQETKRQIKRTIKEVFGKAKFTAEAKFRSFFPSTSATVENTVAEGGALQELYEKFLSQEPKAARQNLTESYPVEVQLRQESPNLDFEKLRKFQEKAEKWNRQAEDALSYGGGQKLVDFIMPQVKRDALYYQEQYLRQWQEKNENRLQTQTEIVHEINYEKLKNKYCDFHNRVEQAAILNPPLAHPIGLYQGSKIRVITKGSSEINFVLKPLQKFCHDIMRKHPVFRLMGKTIELKDVEHLILRKGERWCSGDYKAATNNLNSKLSRWVCEALADSLNLGFYTRNLLIANLVDNKILAPHRHPELSEAGYTEYRQQENGQLMGSIMSFIILCLANATLCRWSMEIGEKKVLTLLQCRLLINGDDCVFCANELTFSTWKQVTAAFGLQLSVGKSYYNKDFFTINSRMFRNYGEGLKKVGLTNLKVFRPITEYCKTITLMTIDQAYLTLLNEADPEFRSAHKKWFFEFYKDMLKDCKLPWHVPKWLGGLGLHADDEDFDMISDLDRRIAKSILLHWNDLKSENVEPIPVVPDLPWNIHLYATEKLPKGNVDYLFARKLQGENLEEQGTEDMTASAYRLYCIEAFLTGTFKLTTGTNLNTRTKHWFKRNALVWEVLRDTEYLSKVGRNGLSNWDMTPRVLPERKPIWVKHNPWRISGLGWESPSLSLF